MMDRLLRSLAVAVAIVDLSCSDRAATQIVALDMSCWQIRTAHPARAEEVTLGSVVQDSCGKPVATVQLVGQGQAVLSSDYGTVKVPLDAIFIYKRGLIVRMSKKQFDRLVANANSHP